LYENQKNLLHFQKDSIILVTSVADVNHPNRIMVNLNKDVPNGLMRLRSIFLFPKVLHQSQSEWYLHQYRLNNYFLVSHKTAGWSVIITTAKSVTIWEMFEVTKNNPHRQNNNTKQRGVINRREQKDERYS